MALEAVVFQQDPFVYGVGVQQEQKDNYCNTEEMLAKAGGFGFGASWGTSLFSPTDSPPVDARSCRRRRRRAKIVKNIQEIENQRMTHIAVERNRRRQMNDFLAEIRSMMPESYAQRGDQASIIGGAINFVKELEHFLQSLEARKTMEKTTDDFNPFSSFFSDFFSFPQYSTGSNPTHLSYAVPEKGSSSSSSSTPPPSPSVADVEVTMVDSHANVKIRSKKHPKQLFNMVSGIHSLGLIVLHLNVTSVENMALYSFSVKVEENCQLTTVNEVAAAVYEMVDRFHEEATA